jgi:hypothetical protein
LELNTINFFSLYKGLNKFNKTAISFDGCFIVQRFYISHPLTKKENYVKKDIDLTRWIFAYNFFVYLLLQMP